MVGCHFFSSSTNNGPWEDLRAVILKHLLVVYTMLGSTGANSFIRHCLLVTMSTDERSRSGLQTDTDLKMESVVFNSGAFSACLTRVISPSSSSQEEVDTQAPQLSWVPSCPG